MCVWQGWERQWSLKDDSQGRKLRNQTVTILPLTETFNHETLHNTQAHFTHNKIDNLLFYYSCRPTYTFLFVRKTDDRRMGRHA